MARLSGRCHIVLPRLDFEVECGRLSCYSILPNAVDIAMAVHGKNQLHLQQCMTTGRLCFVCNGQPAIVQNANAEHSLVEGLDVRCVCYR